MDEIEAIMEDSGLVTSSNTECPMSADNAAENHEYDECVNSTQSDEQGPHNVNYEHTTHLHTEGTADFVKKLFMSTLGGTQVSCANEDIVFYSGDAEHAENSSVILDDGNFSESIGTENESNTDDAQFTTDHITSASLEDTEVEEYRKEKFDVELLNYELQVGYKILINLMGAGNRFVNKLFLYPVDDTFPETAEYYSKIKEPIWMMKMKEKFESLAYNDLSEFMTDFRLMIENCYRFNGPDNFVSKKAQKLETMMKQKIALLSRDLREKLLGSVTTDDDILTSAGIRRRVRNPNAPPEDESQVLLSQLRRDKAMRDREDRRQRSDDRKALEVARIQEIQQWEDEFVGEDVRDCLKSMWELPQIGMFVYICMECLGLDEEITQYQLERGLVAPRECSDFKRLMTYLLSTQHQRKSVKVFMPYSVWNKKLCQKLDYFYKALSDYGGNHQQACYKLGFDNRAFRIMGKSNPLLRKQFHQLSFLKRVWILKSYCDHCVDAQTYLQKTIEETEAERPMDVREVLLGSDGRGNRYINFPMFTGKDIRIYRYPKLQEPSLSSLGLEDWSMVEEKPSASSSRCSTPVNQRGRYSEPQSSSLRARAILQAAESNDPSPVRDLVRSSPDLHDENSNSNQGTSSVCSETPDSSKTKTGGSCKKRKKTGFFGKRKRLKAGPRRELAVDDYADSPGTEEGSVKGEDNEDSQRFSVPNNPTNQNNDCDITNNSCAVDRKQTLADNHASSPALTSSSSLSPSLTYANITNGVESMNESLPGENRCEDGDKSSHDSVNNKDKKITGVKNDSNGGKEGEEADRLTNGKDVSNGGTNSFSECENKTVNQDSAYLSCDSEKSVHKESDSSVNLSKDEESDVTDQSVTDKTEEKACGDDGKDIVKEEKPVIKSNIKNECVDADSKAVKEEDNVLGAKDDVEKKATSTEGCEQTEVKTEPVVKEEVMEEEESDEEDWPDLGRIELVAESMEEIRGLMNKLSNPDPIKRGKRVYPGVMKPCEEELLGNLTRFHDELIKYERSLFNARIHAQVKLRKEVEGYTEPKPEETKGWESETSQSSKESSDVEDNDSKKDTGSKQPKKVKSKALTEFLSSAASKLMSLNGEANEDSNDSYELDISSRGRLRKRRVIPNNTEDTGLKKRKNLSQDLVSTSSPSPSSSSSTPLSSTSSTNILSQRDPGRAVPSQILSMLTSPSTSQSNSTTSRAQLTSTKPMPCQIVRLVSPRGDTTAYKTVRLAGKPNMLLSPEKIANIQFISSSGIVTIPKSKFLTSTTQSSHPVIQNLLKNQAKSIPSHAQVQNSPVKSLSFADMNKQQQGGLLTKALTLNPSSNTVRVTQNINNAAKPPLKTASRGPGAVVVTQVSNSFISQGGKQVLDLGSLSVTQIQQLVKNQAIQINTGAGNPTTLLLTTGLQQMSTSKGSSGSAASTTLAPSVVGSSSQMKVPGQTVFQTSVPSNSISSKNQFGQMTAIPRSNSSQLPVIRTIINRPALNTVLTTSPTVMGPTGQQVGALSHGMLTVVQGATALKQIPSPRIISSLNQNSFVSSQGANMANKENPVSVSTSSKGVSDVQKANWVNIPMPQKKYASNVTVKALLENRSTKKCDSDAGIGQDEEGDCLDSKEDVYSKHSNKETMGPDELEAVSGNLTAAGTLQMDEIANTGLHVPMQSVSSIHSTSAMVSADTVLCSSSGNVDNVNISIRDMKASSTPSVPASQVLSVDAAIQPLMFSSVQVSLPTVNMKVPSPNTLPSLTHNKHGTTIVQSTKVPIPVASTVDSQSPITQPSLGVDNIVNTAVVIPSSSISLTANSNAIFSKPQAMCFNSPGTHQSTANSNASFSKPQAMCFNSPGTHQSTVNLNSNNPPVNLKNVMLKLTPPKGGSGQFVQGYMTSQGKLVIPQAALFQQQQQQQQLRAGPNRVILANTSQALSLQAGQVQAKAPGLINGNTGAAQAKIVQQNNITLNQNPAMHILGQQNNQLVIANAQQPNSVPANVSARAIPVQSGNPGIKLMLINPSAVPGLQNVQQSGVGGRNTVTANVIPSQAPAVQTSTPAAELVKQIANNTQLQAAAAQQHQGTNCTNKNVQVVSQSLQTNTNQVVQTITPQGNQGVSQLAAQILALQQQGNKTLQFQQQGNKTLQFQQASSQQMHGGIVLAKPAALHQTQGNQSGAISVQLQQLNQMLSPAVRGITQVQIPNTQLQQGVQGSLTAAKPVQQAQMVQLALNPQNANARTVVAQPAARVVQVAGQLSPQIQLANQNPLQTVTSVPQQVGLIIQQPTVLQPGQQILRSQGSNVVQLQQNNTVMQQPQKPLQAPLQQTKQPQIINNSQGRQLNLPSSGNQPQIQFVINPSASSNLSSNSTANINVGRLNNPVIHPVIRAVATCTQFTSPPNGAPPLTSTSLQNLPAAAAKQIPQMVSHNLATSNQLIISPIKLTPQSPIKLTPQSPQARLVSPIRVVSPMQTILQSGAMTDQKANQLVIQNTTQLHNVLQSSKSLPQTGQRPRPTNTPPAAGLTVSNEKGKITSILLGQTGIKQQVISVVPGSQNISQMFSKYSTPVGSVAMSVQPVPSISSSDGPSNQLLPTSQRAPQLSLNGDAITKILSGDIHMAEDNQKGANQFSQLIPGSNGNTQPSQPLVVGPNNVYEINQQNGVGKLCPNLAGRVSQTVTNENPDIAMTTSKQASNRRNTFGGSQDIPKLLTQRHASVEEAINQPMTSEERDEKEAALNLLTLANQPL